MDAPQPRTPRTHGEASRERRDIVSGAVMDEDQLLRFVAGPDGVVTPDVARKLPGRGLWVAADRASVDTAVKKGLFSRAAKTKLIAPAGLADQVETLMTRRLLDALGLARRGGDIISGFEKVLASIRGGRAAWLVEASDGAADGRRKLLSACRTSPSPPQLVGVFSSAELGLALGGENVIHTAFLAGRASGHWAKDVRRLAGFRPLLPEGWREE